MREFTRWQVEAAQLTEETWIKSNIFVPVVLKLLRYDTKHKFTANLQTKAASPMYHSRTRGGSLFLVYIAKCSLLSVPLLALR